MLYAFLLVSIIFLGVLGFFFAVICGKIKENTSTVLVEYEIIEDND